jgi:hypothetical protein
MGSLFSTIISRTAGLATRVLTKPARMTLNAVKATKKEMSQAATAATADIKTTANISATAPKGMSYTTALMDNTKLGTAAKGVGWINKRVGGLGSGIGSIGKTRFGKMMGGLWDAVPLGKVAVGVGFGAGIMYGAGSAAMRRLDARNQQTMSGRGMSSNNLGTDGLTLALSKRRHR